MDKKYNKGDIVYWIKPKQNYERIQFGMVDDQFSNAVCINLLNWREIKTINGVRWDQWQPDYKPQKLPKGWTYNTQLWKFGVTKDYQDLKQAYNSFNIADKDCISENIRKGYLVERTSAYYEEPDTVIEKGTWYLKKRLPMYTPCATSISLPPFETYDTYEQASEALQEWDIERDRIANLSDEDWSIEQIRNKIETWAALYRAEPDEINKVTNFLLGLKDIEDVEVRIFNGIQWRYCKNKKWYNVDAI